MSQAAEAGAVLGLMLSLLVLSAFAAIGIMRGRR